MKPRRRRVVFAALVLALTGEGAAAWLHLQKSPENGSALAWLAGRVTARIGAWWAQRAMSVTLAGVNPERYVSAVFTASPSPQARAVRDELESRYRIELLAFAQSLNARNIRLILLYPPIATVARGRARSVFTRLANELALPLIEPTTMIRHDPKNVYLLPIDAHPSRFGQKLMADAVVDLLRPLMSHRAQPTPEGHVPGRLGDLVPGSDEIVRTVPAYPFRLGANAQGLRMTEIVPRCADRQVVLCLGDSFTFGTPLAAADTYPAQLARNFPDRLIVNAGVGGYSILDQTSLFNELWAEVRVDILVLQLLDINIEQLLWFYPARRTRGESPGRPAEAEQRLLDILAAS